MFVSWCNISDAKRVIREILLYMKETFKINLVDGHLLISDNGNTILVDTGSPLTIHKENSLTFLGRERRVHTSMLGNDIKKISSLSGIEFSTLLGMDIMSGYRVVFDYENLELTFLDSLEPSMEGDVLPLGDIGGAKVVDVEMNGQTLKMAVDTGAPLSYVDNFVTDGLDACGEKEDFNPIVGRYVTKTYELEGKIGGKEFKGMYGNLPVMLGLPLKMVGINGVIGYDFFKSFKIEFDFAAGTMTIAG